MTNPPIPPALTDDEWKHGKYRGNDLLIDRETDGAVGIWGSYEGGIQSPHQLQAIAALCLYDQMFGFTQQDVDWLLAGVSWSEREAAKMAHDPIAFRSWKLQASINQSLADRLQALLPPPELVSCQNEVKP